MPFENIIFDFLTRYTFFPFVQWSSINFFLFFRITSIGQMTALYFYVDGFLRASNALSKSVPKTAEI